MPQSRAGSGNRWAKKNTTCPLLCNFKTLFVCVWCFFLLVYIAWLTNEAGLRVVHTIHGTSAAIRTGQIEQQHTLNRVEYRLAKASEQLRQVLVENSAGVRVGGFDQRGAVNHVDSGNNILGSILRQRQSRPATAYQASLQRAGAALAESNVHSVMEALTLNNHELLNRLNDIRDGALQQLVTLQTNISAQVGGEQLFLLRTNTDPHCVAPHADRDGSSIH